MSRLEERSENVQSRATLPILEVREALLSSVRKASTGGGSAVIMAETGSGKTTQVPWLILESGLAGVTGKVGVTQPRRVAAVSLARRVAEEHDEELGTGRVGYAVRFESVQCEATRLLYQTDGMLLREAMGDPLLSAYSVIVLDEVHERSLHSDVLLGVVREAQRKRRAKILGGASASLPNLLVILMSATMDVDDLAAFFSVPTSEVIYVGGREFQVQRQSLVTPTKDYQHTALVSLFQIHRELGQRDAGGILVFLTGQEEIDSFVSLAREVAKDASLADLPRLQILPLHASLHLDAQQRVFNPTAHTHRRVIVATNIAETSLTIPGIAVVIDSGKVKVRMYEPSKGIDMLKVVNISQAQAEQRAGRAGRERDGKVYRLYTDAALANFPAFPTPEILRSNVAGVELHLLSMGMDLERLSLVDKPSPESLAAGVEELCVLGAVERVEGRRRVTELGRQMSAFPVEPKLARALIASAEIGCSEEMLWIVAGLAGGHIFISSATEANEESRKAAAARFNSIHGDHQRLLKIARDYSAMSGREASDWCKANFLQPRSLAAIRDIRRQLRETMEKSSLRLVSCGADFDKVRRALCYGLFLNAAMLEPGPGTGGSRYRVFHAGHNAAIHPSSSLHGHSPAFFLYTELVFTNQLYARDLSSIQPQWLWDAVPEFCRKHRIPTS